MRSYENYLFAIQHEGEGKKGAPLFNTYFGSPNSKVACVDYVFYIPFGEDVGSKNQAENEIHVYFTLVKNYVILEWGNTKVPVHVDICEMRDGEENSLIQSPTKTVLSINEDNEYLVNLFRVMMAMGDNYQQLLIIRLGFLDYIPFDVVFEILMDYVMIIHQYQF